MMREKLRILGTQAVIATWLVGFATLGQAGTAVVAMKEGGEFTYEYGKHQLRVDATGDDNYVVVRDGKLYAVTYQGGQPMVIDASSVMKEFASTIQQNAPTDLSAEIVSMKRTGNKDVVAGVKGEVYSITVLDKNGEKRVEEAVLSKDRRAREFTEALFLMTEARAEAIGGGAIESERDFETQLARQGLGFLRYGTEMSLTSIDSDRVPDERFVLPAEPMDTSGLSGLWRKANEMTKGQSEVADGDSGKDDETSHGLLGSMMGILGKKVDRQADRVGNSVENEADRETDKAVDTGISKLWDKLLGN